MGVAAGTKTIETQIRYSHLRIDKEMQFPEAGAAIHYETGYFDETNAWVRISDETIRAYGDAVWFMFGLTGADVGATNDQVGTVLETIIYGIITDQIKLSAQLDLTITDEAGGPVDATVRILKGGEVMNVHQAPGGILSTENDLHLDAVLEVTAARFDPYTESFAVLNGDIQRAITLVATVA